jgi:drug/metabolite transporter (DMT)-like permease
VGLVVAFAGVTLIAYATSDEGSNGDVLGVVLCLVACVSYAVSVVLQKPLLPRLPALDLTFLATVVGTLATLPFLPQLAEDTQAAPTSSVVFLIYLGVFPTAVAFTTYAYALTHLSASTLGLSTYLVPPITVVIAWVTLGETPPPLAYVGGVLCLAGVWWARRRPARERSAVPEEIVDAG